MKNELEKKYEEFGYNGEFIQVGFVLADLSQGQIQFQVIENSNKFLQEIPVVDISVFFIDMKLPCMKVNFATYNVCDSISYTGNLIATCQHSLLAVKSSFRGKKYFYVQDLSWLEDRFKRTEALEFIKSDEVTIFCRSKDHKDHLISLGYKVHPKIVEDCNIKDILGIINDKSRAN